MDKYDEEAHHFHSSGWQPRGGGAPLHQHQRHDNFRGRGGGRNSPNNYPSGFSSGGGRGSGGGGRENHRPYDSPPPYPQPSSRDGGVGGLRPIDDGIGGFRPTVGGVDGEEGFSPMSGGGGRGGFRPIGRVDGGGYPPMGGDGFQSMRGGRSDGGGFRPMGGGSGSDVGGFQPMGGGGSNGGGFQPTGGNRRDSPVFRPIGGSDSDTGGFRPMGGGGSDGGSFGLDNYHVQPSPLTGQKRGYPFPGRERSPGREGASFAKLFVGSVPRTATENDIRPLFDKHGHVLEVALIKDKRTGIQQGCCFIKYASSEEADRAIRALHNQYTLPGGMGPIQVRYADGERERLGAMEYKLFVGSLNKKAAEKEVEEIFTPYGRVEDVYLMRDEMKQSRGCGFVKYSQREMAQAAINALNGTYTMGGCDQPLSVRFADPKRPKPGDSRDGLSFSGPGSEPRFPAPGNRPPPDQGQLLSGPIPPNSWPQISLHNQGPASHVGNHGFGNQFQARSGDMAVSSTPDPVGGLSGNAVSLPGPTGSSAPVAQNLNQPLPRAPSFGSKISPVQRPIQSPQDMPSSMHLQPFNAASFSNVQTLQGSHMQQGQMQTPHSSGRSPYMQAPSSQQLPGRNGTATQVQHNDALTTPGQTPGVANQQRPPSQQFQQSPSQLAQMLSQQKQTLQATFQSSQQALNQLQQQLHQLQPSNHNLTPHQGPLGARPQSHWAGTYSQPVANPKPTGDLATTTSASSTTPAVTPAITSVNNCNWTEHMSPDGYKYYYNGLTGESKWEKPEELMLYEQQQQNPSKQHNQVQSHQTEPSTQQAPQMQVQLQGPHRAQLHNQAKPLQQPSQSSVPVFPAKQGTKELGYAQIPPVNDPSRYQQGAQGGSQEWMWTNKN
ncbi:hypothetical protein ACP275_07G003500 [Erythranthe tilingii]